ncbi:extracellular solute-binding protein [Marinicrinis sediminis]|uniref:Extracellular solute-binding protein n=1 Tax=Marinicrinis sediminis TaxID=1652465 RepID=A0ABW5REV4_9BACL
MKKNVMVIVSIVLILSMVLGACSNNQNANGNDSSPSQNNGEGNGGSSSEGSNEITFPLDESVTLDVVARREPLAPSDFNENQTAQKIEEMTNVKVQWDTIVSTDYQEKKNLLLASNDLPDVFLGADFNDSELLKYGNEGTIIPLNDLIDQHMPNLKKILDERPDIRGIITAPDGNIYSLPVGEELGSGQEEIGANPDFLYINTEWLDRLGLEMPTTIEEYTEVLRAFKAEDANGNGDKNDEIPLTYIDGFWTGDIGYLFGAFGVPDKTYQPQVQTFIEHLNVEDGEVKYAPLQEGYKEAVSYVHQWFAEDLVDLEAFTHDYTSYFALGKQDPLVLGSFLWWDKNDVVAPNGYQYAIVPPFKDMVVKWNNGSMIGRNGSVITVENEHPEITAKWLDTMYEPRLAAEARWGPIGVWFEEDENGMLVQKDDIENPGEFRQKVALNNGVGLITGEHFKSVVAPEERAKARIDDMREIFAPQMQDEKFPLLFFTEEELEVIERIKPDVLQYTAQMRAKFLMEGGVDSNWDDFIATIQDMGIEELLEVYQSAYDRYKEAQ